MLSKNSMVQNKNNKIGIGFKNFRRFSDFPVLELGETTYLVGRNNAGKSTMVKALLLVTDYINNQLSDTFAFDNKVLNDANIVTYGRAHNTKTDEPFICFTIQLGTYECKLSITGEPDDTQAKVSEFSLKNTKTDLEFVINYIKKETFIRKSVKSKPKSDSSSEQRKSLQNEIISLEHQLETLDRKSREGLTTIDRINRLKSFLEGFPVEKTEEKITKQFELTYPLRLDENVRTENNELLEILKDMIDLNYREYRNMIGEENVSEFNDEKEEELFKENFEKVKILDTEKKNIIQDIEEFIRLFQNEEFYYLGANPSKQSALFSLRDKSNALAQAIHEFHQLKIQVGDQEYSFVKHWMKEFEVGEDFKIKFLAGEAYEFFVLKNGYKNYLADKGMGSLQAMMLILRIASLIRKNKKDKKNLTILVEEPELNLHPALQSKLTNLFHEVNMKYGFKFIIETHSEYLIRKSQLIGLSEDYNYFENNILNPNPFKVFYFHSEHGPYEMNYTKQGRFDRDFGSGFYDEASKINMESIKKGRLKK